MKDINHSCCDKHQEHLVPYEDVRRELLSLVAPSCLTETIGLGEVTGRTIAKAVTAPMPLPIYDNSAVDGYVLGPDSEALSYRVVARTAAGDAPYQPDLLPGEAVRIFTGARIPASAVSVVMQEDIQNIGDQIFLTAPAKKAGHIRRRGEDVGAGETLIAAGSKLDARHVAIMAASGVSEVLVCAPVKVALFSSGKELCDPGSDLGTASIHDSNRWMLRSLLAGPDVEITDLGILPDNRDDIATALENASKTTDIILSTGGVCDGEEDHVLSAFRQAGGQPQQRKMAVKPGKPVVFGKIGKAVAVCLPGNPVAALVSFALLARPCLDIIRGSAPSFLAASSAIAGFDWSRKPGRAEFFPARIIDHSPQGLPILEKLSNGGSALLKPLIAADGLARFDTKLSELAVGDQVDWFPFKAGFAL